MRQLTMAAAVALTLGACGTNESTSDNGAIPAEDAAATAQNGVASLEPVGSAVAPVPSNGGVQAGGDNDSMEWRLSRTAAGPKLAFGEPQTDNVRLNLRCADDQVTLHFMRSAEVVASRPGQLTVASGGMQWRSDVSATESELGGMSVSASLPESSAPMTAFKSGKSLEVRWGGETIRVPGTDKAQQFLSACG